MNYNWKCCLAISIADKSSFVEKRFKVHVNKSFIGDGCFNRYLPQPTRESKRTIKLKCNFSACKNPQKMV